MHHPGEETETTTTTTPVTTTMATNPAETPVRKVHLSEGLHGQDRNFESLNGMWEQMQLASVETAFPDLDLLTFAQVPSTLYFAVVMDAKKMKNPPSTRTQSSWVDPDWGMSDDDDDWSPEMPTGAPLVNVTNGDSSTDFGPRRDSFQPQAYPARSHKRNACLGLVYLTVSGQYPAVSSPGEVNVGLYISEEYSGQGYGKDALELVLEHAFESMKCHRVQAVIMESPLKGRALKLFTRMRFVHEGTRRRAYFSHMEQQWKDTTCLAILDTDWAMRSYFKSGPRTLWDEMFTRQAWEREQLLRWESKSLRRANSSETIRAVETPMESDSEEASGSESERGRGEEYDSAHAKIFWKELERRMLVDSQTEAATREDSQAGGSPVSSQEDEEQSFLSLPSTPHSELEGYQAEWDILSNESGSEFSPMLRASSQSDGDDSWSELEH